MQQNSDEQRTVPRFPLPKEKIKFVFEEGEKIFAVRDISLRGVGISLLEFGESLFFPEGYSCQAELKFDSVPMLVKVRVVRVSAWSVGFVFESLTADQQEHIQGYVNPLHIGTSLRLVDQKAAPEAFLQGMSSWYHGDSGADLFLWSDTRGGVSRALLCVGQNFWEWSHESGVFTGEVERLEGDKVVLHKDATPDPKTRVMVRKVLEHANVLDYRLGSFLRDQT